MKKKNSRKPRKQKMTSNMKVWDKVSQVEIKSKDECINAFLEIVKLAQKGKYKFEEGHRDKGKYYIVNESNRGGSSFVHVVPKEVYKNFLELQKKLGDTFLGFSILCGKNGDKDLRVSCFAISTNDLTRALIKS